MPVERATESREGKRFPSKVGSAGSGPSQRDRDVSGGTESFASAAGGDGLVGRDALEELRVLFERSNAVARALERSHEALQLRVAHLQDELAEKDRLLERKRRLEALGQIAAGVAHEVGNPLGGISLYLDCLASEVKGHDEGTRLIGKIQKGIQHLKSIVHDILTFTEPGQVHVTPCDLGSVIGEAISLLQLDLDQNGVRVTGAGNGAGAGAGTVEGDRDQLRRIFLNVIRNSIQAMPDGGEVEIDISPARPDEDGEEEVRVEIRDNGPGLRPEHLERVFTPFFSVREGGTGLGLAIVHSLVENHGGRIDLANRPGGGLVAAILLPRRHPAGRAAATCWSSGARPGEVVHG